MIRIAKQKAELSHRYEYCLNSLNKSLLSFFTIAIIVNVFKAIPIKEKKYDEILKQFEASYSNSSSTIFLSIFKEIILYDTYLRHYLLVYVILLNTN